VYNKNLTLRHLIAENIQRRSIYSIIKRSEYLPIKRKAGSGQITKKMEKRRVNQVVKSCVLDDESYFTVGHNTMRINQMVITSPDLT
jgi:hypothetical protein